jgi:hypothetical protein
MPRQLIAFIFLTAFTMQTFSKAVVVAWFYVNQKQIAATLCENRDKPKMNCCGKCQLKKEIAKEDKQQDKAPFAKFENKSELLYCSHPEINLSQFPSTEVIPLQRIYSSKAIARASGIFKPPC